MTVDRPTRWRDAIIGRMIAEGAGDVSDAEIRRCLASCVCGGAIIEAATVLRADGRLTLKDIQTDAPTLFDNLAAE